MTADDRQKLGALMTRACTDPAFKARLLADGTATLAECGAHIAPGVTVKVVEDTGAIVHLVLPAMPASAEMTLDRLDKIAGGMGNPFGDGPGQIPWSEYHQNSVTWPG